jgi:hypothetical protein
MRGKASREGSDTQNVTIQHGAKILSIFDEGEYQVTEIAEEIMSEINRRHRAVDILVSGASCEKHERAKPRL